MNFADEVPYEKIDVEMRRLIRLMNSFPGIQTRFCCAGHEQATGEPESTTGYVSFRADCDEDLARLLKALPFQQQQMFFVNNRPFWQAIWVHVSLSPEPDCEVDYILRFEGSGLTAQRQLLERIERSLATAVADFDAVQSPGGS